MKWKIKIFIINKAKVSFLLRDAKPRIFFVWNILVMCSCCNRMHKRNDQSSNLQEEGNFDLIWTLAFTLINYLFIIK